MVFAPVWYVRYSVEENGRLTPYYSWAWYSAINGRMVEDCYSF